MGDYSYNEKKVNLINTKQNPILWYFIDFDYLFLLISTCTKNDQKPPKNRNFTE